MSTSLTLIGSVGKDTVTGGSGNDIITAGSGVDSMTGGSGKDTFVFALGDNGDKPSGTVFDSIADYLTGTDTISFTGLSISQFKSTTTQASTVAGVTSSGVVSFDAGDNTLALKVAAVANAIGGSSAGNALYFAEGSDGYVFVTDGTSGIGANDVLIKLIGLSTFTKLTLTNGAITGFSS
jgi:Ca2+-binding RTX toxin-like protein